MDFAMMTLILLNVIMMVSSYDDDGSDCCGRHHLHRALHWMHIMCFHQETCLAGVTHAFVGDGVCNDETNIAECDYDGGYCCPNPNMVGDFFF